MLDEHDFFYCFKLKEGADLDDLLAEMDEELPSDKEGEEEEEEDEEDYGLTEVQKRSRHGPFGEQVSLADIINLQQHTRNRKSRKVGEWG